MPLQENVIFVISEACRGELLICSGHDVMFSIAVCRIISESTDVTWQSPSMSAAESCSWRQTTMWSATMALSAVTSPRCSDRREKSHQQP